MIKPIAFYLPQFHPIPENDEWWGKGFTEWTNVTKAKPLFDGHIQPRLPSDLGFYDLRLPEAREAQASLAKEYGIFGFCYWHYWFGGKQILERPLQEVVASGKPDFPFCLAWANQTWEGTWHGLSSNKVLIEQTYPGTEDHEKHFYALLSAFKDDRYIKVDGKNLFFIFKPLDLPNPNDFIKFWRELAIKENINDFYFVGLYMNSDWDYKSFGFDAFTQDWQALSLLSDLSISKKISLSELFLKRISKKITEIKPRSVSYSKYSNLFQSATIKSKEYPLICSDWDNTPRSGIDGWLFNDFTLTAFEQNCYNAIVKSYSNADSDRIVLIKSWNEWAEGNYLEPDQRYGLGLLKAFKRALERVTHL